MKQKRITTIVLSFLMMLFSSFSVFAGTWTEHTDNTWTYVNDDGESVTGWIEDNGSHYYLDKDGYKKTGWV